MIDFSYLSAPETDDKESKIRTIREKTDHMPVAQAATTLGVSEDRVRLLRSNAYDQFSEYSVVQMLASINPWQPAGYAQSQSRMSRS
jgi:hypothetical protein